MSVSKLRQIMRLTISFDEPPAIFDSISKPGYHSAFTAQQLAEARQQGLIDHRVMALGGVTFNQVNNVMKMGFGGAMILGDAWK